MTPLETALRRKYQTPQQAMQALGLDEALLKERNISMTKVLSRKAALILAPLVESLQPKLALDAKNIEFAGDAKPADITKFFEALKDMKIAVDEWPDEEEKKKKDDDKDEDDKKARDKKAKGAKDEDPEDKDDKKDKKAEDSEEDDEDEEKKKKEAEAAKDKKVKGAKDEEKDDDKDKKDKAMDTVTRPAMDAAIAAAVKSATDNATKTQSEIRDAERAVRPYVGDLAMAHDSAESVYRTALKVLGVKQADDIHASALATILSMQPKAGVEQRKSTSVAMDSAGMKSLYELCPGIERIRVL